MSAQRPETRLRCAPTAQDVLGNASMQGEFHHLIGCVLTAIAAEQAKKTRGAKIDILLAMTLKLLGYYAIANTGNQETLHWGQSPTPLQRLCALSIRYFTEPQLKGELFPTLIACCYRNGRNCQACRMARRRVACGTARKPSLACTPHHSPGPAAWVRSAWAAVSPVRSVCTPVRPHTPTCRS